MNKIIIRNKAISHNYLNIINMWYQEDPRIINAKVIEYFDYGIIFNHRYLSPIMPSKRTVKRDFLIEKNARSA